MFLNHFDVLMLKIILKKIKKYYFNTYMNKKHFDKQPQLYSQAIKSHP
jgi:YHS domain-containing protein